MIYHIRITLSLEQLSKKQYKQSLRKIADLLSAQNFPHNKFFGLAYTNHYIAGHILFNIDTADTQVLSATIGYGLAIMRNHMKRICQTDIVTANETKHLCLDVLIGTYNGRYPAICIDTTYTPQIDLTIEQATTKASKINYTAIQYTFLKPGSRKANNVDEKPVFVFADDELGTLKSRRRKVYVLRPNIKRPISLYV